MDKKIISILFLLIIVLAVTATYVVYNQPSAEEKQEGSFMDIVTDEEINSEIDDVFLDEDDEIEIGEMI